MNNFLNFAGIDSKTLPKNKFENQRVLLQLVSRLDDRELSPRDREPSAWEGVPFTYGAVVGGFASPPQQRTGRAKKDPDTYCIFARHRVIEFAGV